MTRQLSDTLAQLGPIASDLARICHELSQLNDRIAVVEAEVSRIKGQFLLPNQ